MDKFQNWMEKHVAPISTKIASNREINVISRSFTAILPITMVGALISLLNYINILGFQDFLINTGIKGCISLIVSLTTNAISLYLLIAIAYTKARYFFDETESKIVTILTVFSFLLLIPMTEGNVTLGWLGARGMFVAMICGLLVPSFYKLVVEHFAIKLPDSVPPFVADGFKAIIPALFIAIICCGINMLFVAIGLESLPQAIYFLLAKPFKALSGSIWAYVLTVFIMQVLWFFGIHGGSTMGGIQMVLFMEATTENIAASAAGTALPNVITLGLANVISAGVSYVALCSILIFICKREDFKAIGKLAIVPAFFGVFEPLRFGLPFVLNPTLFFPAACLAPINAIVSYLTISLGWVSRPRVSILSGMPLFVDSFLEVGISAVILSVVMMVIDFFIWIPFIKMYEKQKNEMDAAALSDAKN